MSTTQSAKAKPPGKGPPRKKPRPVKPGEGPPAKGKKLSNKTLRNLTLAGVVFIALIAAGTSFYFKSGTAGENADIEVLQEEVVKNPLPEPVQLLLDQGMLSEALDALGPAVDADPTNLDLIVESARLHVKGGRFKGAKGLAEKAVAIDENNGTAHAIIGLTLFQDAQFEESLIKSLYAVELDDKESLAYLTIGKIYLRQKKLKDALAVLKQAARLDSANPVIWTQISSVYLKQKDYPRGLLAGKAALEANPDYPAAHFNLSVVYFRQNNLAKAIEHIEKAEALYRAQANEHWVGKTRHNKKMYLEKFQIRAEDISKGKP